MSLALDRTGSASMFDGLIEGTTRICRRTTRATLIAANIVGLIALAGMTATETIDDDLTFQPPAATEGGLASIDMAAALIEREAANHAWVSNEPVFMPGAWLNNMQAYQEGMIYGLSRFTYEFADTLGRTRGSTSVDPDLDRAAGLLRFPGNVWIFDFEKTWTPTITSEEQYLSAARALAAYNQRISSGNAVFDPRVDSLLAALTRIEADISSKANVLVSHVERGAAGLPVETNDNEIFYGTKGRLYAYAMVLEALGQDFEPIIEREGIRLVWDRMINSLKNAAAMHPFFITDSPPGSMFLPSHVAEIGFFTLRAKTQLRDVMAVMSQG
ncbi:MAG: DUF2333 family protein [Pseudomonadota bacterium]